ncbi:MAG: NAD-dependent epimerase/dehydratase family protein [Saprospiraceae bacterium]
MNNDRVLVTGASGFLGNHIIKALTTKGFINIFGLIRNPEHKQVIHHPNVTWIEGDICDMPRMVDILEDIDTVINAASEVSFSIRHKKQMIKTAIDGTANVVNAAMYAGVKKLIHISSVAALGRRKLNETINENSIFNHSKYDTSYGLAKFLAEQEVWRAHAEGLHTTIFNPSMILGIGNWHSSTPQLWNKIYHGLDWYGIGSTGWVDVSDVAKVIVDAIDQDLNGERYILSGENLPYKDIFTKIAIEIGKKPPTKPLKGFLASAFANIEHLRSIITNSKPIITTETIVSTSANSNYDNTKSVQMLNCKYTPISHTIQKVSSAFLNSVKEG